MDVDVVGGSLLLFRGPKDPSSTTGFHHPGLPRRAERTQHQGRTGREGFLPAGFTGPVGEGSRKRSKRRHEADDRHHAGAEGLRPRKRV